MTKSFNPNRVVICKVTNVPAENFFFAKNGDPTQIFCHYNQGSRLSVTPNGNIAANMNDHPEQMPMIGDEIALIRMSDEPIDREFTKAAVWVPGEDWNEVKWAMYAHNTFRAVAYNHRTDGKFQSNTPKDVVLVQGELIEIINSNPRRGYDKNHLSPHHTTKALNRTFSYDTRWERYDGFDSDGKEIWSECADPRPVLP